MLLFVDYEVPHYDLFAGSRTNFMYLKLLVQMGLDVKLLPADFRRVEPYSSELNHLGIETLDGEWFQANWENWLRENGQAIDYVFFHKPDPASVFLPAVKSHTHAAIIYQCHDLHYLRLRRKAGVEKDDSILEEAERYEQREDFIFSNSDVLLTFSEVEEKFLQEKFPDKKVFTVPLFFYEDVPDVNRDFGKRHDLLYVGACAHTPNHDAVSWFCTEILPLIRESNSDIALNVVGANPSADIAALASDSVRILGRVSEEKLDSLYASARMMVVPLRFGAGVKGKVIETWYKGVPLVSTSIGLEGIKGIERLASAQNSAEDFAAEVIRLYSNEAKLEELSRLGSEYVASNFTSDATAELMTVVLSASKDAAELRLARDLLDKEQEKPPRVIAFYLPQYHPIPENDEWWGEGFTEWHNVSKAEPLFSGHYQPHVPADLGYYDLRDEKTRIDQAALAQEYGIEGFCYYHYWFSGRRLLEHPLEELLKTGRPEFPFCLCWANESWTRRWDGKELEILMKQEYSEEDDIRHIRSLIPVFNDKRYIRVNGKPLFLVYRTDSIPDPARTAETWREEARKAGIGELYLCRAESFVKCDPHEIGFDASVEFAPDWWNKGPQLKADSDLLNSADSDLTNVCENNFIHSYAGLAEAMMAKKTPGYKWFRCVTPAWDNWARRHEGASIFLDSTPGKYQDWLSFAVDHTNSHHVGEERLVFVNAWNEWAEGNHLEPDEKFGHAYLEATKQALEEGQLVSNLRKIRFQDDHQVSGLVSELTTLKYQVKELNQEIEELKASTSWRVTVPLRWIKCRLLDLKRTFFG